MSTPLLNKILILLAALSLLNAIPCHAESPKVAFIAGSSTTWNSLAKDTLIIKYLTRSLGYDTRILNGYAMRDSSLSFWESLDGVIISGTRSNETFVNSYLSKLSNAAVPIVTLSRDSYNELKLAANPYYVSFSVAGTAAMQKACADHWITRPLSDTIFFYWNGGSSTFGWWNWAPGATKLFVRGRVGRPGSDTAMIAVFEKGGQLTQGTLARERRSLFAGFCPMELDGTIGDPGWCHPWETFARVVAWTLYDTLNNAFTRSACFAGDEEVEWCWTELGHATGSADGTFTYNYQRAGIDNDAPPYNYGKIISFTKINPSSLARKVPAGCSIDSISIIRFLANFDKNGHGTYSRFDFMEYWHLITNPVKWYAPSAHDVNLGYSLNPPCNVAVCGFCMQCIYWRGLYVDSGWVNRFRVNKRSSTDSVAWHSPDLQSGTDYASVPIDSIHYSPASTPLHSWTKILIPGSIANQWLADTSTNNGIVGRPVNLLSSSADPYDIELMYNDITMQTAADSVLIRMYLSPQQNDVCGDLDQSNTVDVADLILLIKHVFGEQLEPGANLLNGDVDCDGAVSITDVVYTINFMFNGGADLCAGCLILSPASAAL